MALVSSEIQDRTRYPPLIQHVEVEVLVHWEKPKVIKKVRSSAAPTEPTTPNFQVEEMTETFLNEKMEHGLGVNGYINFELIGSGVADGGGTSFGKLVGGKLQGKLSRAVQKGLVIIGTPLSGRREERIEETEKPSTVPCCAWFSHGWKSKTENHKKDLAKDLKAQKTRLVHSTRKQASEISDKIQKISQKQEVFESIRKANMNSKRTESLDDEASELNLKSIKYEFQDRSPLRRYLMKGVLKNEAEVMP